MKHMIIVVADSTRARIFTIDSAHSPLNEIETMAHPEGRVHEQNLVSDLPGKALEKGAAETMLIRKKLSLKGKK